MDIYCVKINYSRDCLHTCWWHVSYFSHQPTLDDVISSISGDWEDCGEYEQESFLPNTLKVITKLTDNGIPQLDDICVSNTDYWACGQGTVEVIRMPIIMNNHEEGTGT